MPAPETAFRRQKAVLWPKPSGVAGYDSYGQARAGAAVELDVRWNQVTTQMSDPEGNPITVDATVVVDREVPVGSTMWLGELADWYGTGSEFGDDQVMEVKAQHYTRDLKGRFTRRTLGLTFYKDALPGA